MFFCALLGDLLEAWVRLWPDSTVSQAARPFKDVVVTVTASSPLLNTWAALQTAAHNNTAEQSVIVKVPPISYVNTQLRVRQAVLFRREAWGAPK